MFFKKLFCFSHLPLEGVGLHLKKLKFYVSNDALCHNACPIKIDSVILEKILKTLQFTGVSPISLLSLS